MQKLKLGVWGGPGRGKTYTVCSAPPPVYVLETEYGISQLFKQFPEKDIKVVHVNVASGDDIVQDACASLALVEEALDALADLTEGTIAIDSVSDVWQWVQMRMKSEILELGPTARIQPSDYTWGNVYYKKIMMKARSIGTHLVLTAHEQEKFSDARLTSTGIYVARWQKWTPQYIDAVVHLTPPADESSKLINVGVVNKCRFMSLFNKRYENFQFSSIFEDIKGFL